MTEGTVATSHPGGKTVPDKNVQVPDDKAKMDTILVGKM
jgi:hypothetical protein